MRLTPVKQIRLESIIKIKLIKMTNHGGKRQGAGNKEGSERPNFYKFVEQTEVREFMDWVKKNYKKNPRLAIWYGDHLFGKASLPITGDGGGPLTIVLTKYAKSN
ncbi:MAG: hypothetical protein ACYC1K_00860 [Minisyncoccota bacterium]